MAVRAPFAWINSSKAHNDKCHKSKRMPDFSQQWGLNMAVYLWLMLRWLCVSVCVCVCLEASVACSCADEVSASRRLKRHTFTLSHSGLLLKSLYHYNKCACVCVCQAECEWSMSSGYSRLPHNGRVSASVQTLWLEETSTIYLLTCSRNSKSAKS